MRGLDRPGDFFWKGWTSGPWHEMHLSTEMDLSNSIWWRQIFRKHPEGSKKNVANGQHRKMGCWFLLDKPWNKKHVRHSLLQQLEDVRTSHASRVRRFVAQWCKFVPHWTPIYFHIFGHQLSVSNAAFLPFPTQNQAPIVIQVVVQDKYIHVTKNHAVPVPSLGVGYQLSQLVDDSCIIV